MDETWNGFSEDRQSIDGGNDSCEHDRWSRFGDVGLDGLTIMDYPGLAIILFLLAAFGGLTLLFKILFQEERMKKKEGTVRLT